MKIFPLILLSVCGLSACSTSQTQQQNTVQKQCKVDENIQRHAIPATPNNMSLPAFGQGVIGWATGEEGAKQRLQSVEKQDIASFKKQGVTLVMLQEWQAFYENEQKRNPCNPTAAYRAQLMQKIVMLWTE